MMQLESVRPTVRVLSDPLLETIIDEARHVLSSVGIALANEDVSKQLLAAGARLDEGGTRLLVDDALVDRALASAPPEMVLYDREGEPRAHLGGSRVHFTPGSAAIHLLDGQSRRMRPPTTRDYIRYARLVERLDAIDYASTAFIASDVHERVSDSYRLYLSLIYGESPVVTGAFTIEGLEVMVDLLRAVRGDGPSLAERPLAIFSCCPTAPLKWSDVTSQNVVDCARYGIPIELISMPLTGFVAPGTLVGTLVQHTAETLSGLVISQTAEAGAPVLWGGSPAVFDYRCETTPMGAIETQMIALGYAEIGKRLGLPTQAYIGLSDAKRLDAQAGLESATGVMLAALAGINSISGPGMLDFESCQSLEKLVLDNEICAMARRLLRGVEPREGDFPALPHFQELLREGHAIIADHTRRWIDLEIGFPGPVIDRVHRARYLDDGAVDLETRARERVAELLEEVPEPIDADRRGRLDDVMRRAAAAVGMDELPAHDV